MLTPLPVFDPLPLPPPPPPDAPQGCVQPDSKPELSRFKPDIPATMVGPTGGRRRRSFEQAAQLVHLKLLLTLFVNALACPLPGVLGHGLSGH